MQEFDYQLRPRIVFGQGGISRLGELAREYIVSDEEKPVVLLVSDPGVVAAGIYDRGRESLEAAGLTVVGFHDFSENPNTESVNLGVALAKQVKPQLLVGLGGGSSMDCAKGINFVYSCGGEMKDYWGIGKATGPMLPFIAIPTTSGTGSETQSFALISDSQTHAKMACGDIRATCKVTILDPQLTFTQPDMVTALTGIDAITHALESYVCNKRNPMSQCFAMQAWTLLSAGFPAVLEKSDDWEARERMQLGASFAGMAIECSMLGIAHSLANPLTAQLGTAHGQAVGMMMPHVIRFNVPAVEDLYAQLWKACGAFKETVQSGDGAAASDNLASLLNRWLLQASLKTHLRDLAGWPTVGESASGENQEEALLELLAEGAAKQWTATFNPRSVTKDDLLQIYRNAL